MGERKFSVTEKDDETTKLKEEFEGLVPQKEGFALKYITTAVIYYCNITFGISALFLAPIVVDFRNAYNTDMATLSWMFTISRAFMLLAYSVYGVIFNHVNRHALVTVLLCATGILMWVMPYCTTIISFSVINVLRLIAYAGWATAQAVWVIEIWKEAAGPYIQGQHFCFALGAMLPSLIFAPFLKESSLEAEALAMEESAAILREDPLYPLKYNSSNTFLTEETQSLSRLYFPTAICAILVVLGAVFQLILFFVLKSSKSEGKNRQVKVVKEEYGSSPELKSVRKRKISLIILAATLVGACQIMETIAFQFLPSYVVYSNPALSEVDGAHIMSAHTAAYTVGRFAGIFIIFKLKPQTLLIINILFVVAANVVFTIATGSEAYEMLMGGSVLLGIGFSTVIPCVYDYVKVHLEITNVVASVFMVVGGTLTAIFPIAVGIFLEETPAIVLYLNFACVFVIGGTLSGIVLLMRGHEGKV